MPSWKADIRARLNGVNLAPAREAEIVEELAQHLDDRWRELIAGGVAAGEAERLLRAELHESDLLARRLAGLRQAHWSDPVPPTPRRWYALGGLLTDLRDAVRSLRAAPGFTAVALVVLTLGIGATTAIFSVVDAVVLRGLPFDEPEQLVAVGERWSRTLGGKPGGPLPFLGSGDPLALRNVQPQNYLDWAAGQQAFTGIAALADADVTMQPPGGEPESVRAKRITANLFDILRIRPALGRAFTSAEETDAARFVVVLSDALWRNRFGADPQILARSIQLDDGSYRVVGVMPAGVTYPPGGVQSADLWMPYVVPPTERTRGRGHSIYLQCVARLKPGVSFAQAQAQMDQLGTAIERANPVWGAGVRIGVRPLRDHLIGASTRSWMLMLLASVAIVLLIACANVASLLLARATAREQEVAVRAALGAGRWRLIRQFIVESVTLSLAGAALAIFAAWWAVGVLRQAMPEGVPRAAAIALDLRVLTVALGISLATGVVFGIVPAFQFSRPNLATSLNRGTRSAGVSLGRQRLRRVLVTAEIALAVVLLVGAALFVGSFIRVMRIDSGFDPNHVLTAQLYVRSVPGGSPTRGPDLAAAFAEIVDRLGQTSGVVHAGAVGPGIPLSVRQWWDGMNVPGKPPDRTGLSIKVITPEYHRVLSIPLRRGRYFTSDDHAAAEKVVILNESAAKSYFSGEDPVGRSAVVDGVDRTIVGVVADVRQARLEAAADPEIYLPMSQSAKATGYLVIRTAGDPMAALASAKTIVSSVLPSVPLREVATMDQLVARQTAERRLNMLMLGLFGLLGLVISAVGLYGVMAYLVSQRTREIGVRMALGASRAEVVRMVVGNAGGLLALGLLLGGIAAWSLSVNASRFLFELDAHDPRAFAAAVLVLSIAALLAAWIPARRAASVDPTVALRSE